MKIGHSLKHMAKTMKHHAIESREYDRMRDIDYFTDWCTAEWGNEVAKYALDNLKNRKRNKMDRG